MGDRGSGEAACGNGGVADTADIAHSVRASVNLEGGGGSNRGDIGDAREVTGGGQRQDAVVDNGRTGVGANGIQGELVGAQFLETICACDGVGSM